MVHVLILMNIRKIKWFQNVREKVKSPGQTWRSWHQHSCELSWSLLLWSMSTQRQAFCSTKIPLSSISYYIHSFYARAFCLKHRQSTINVHKLYIDLPVVIPPNGTYPWCTLVPDRDPMEALVKSWFAVHSMNSQSTNYFEPTPTNQIEARQTYRHQHTHNVLKLLDFHHVHMQGPRHICCRNKGTKKTSVCTKHWRCVPLNAKLKCLGLQTTLCWINRIRFSCHF